MRTSHDELECVFDDCGEPAAYSLSARWPDHLVWTRDVCSAHLVRGIESLGDLSRLRGRQADNDPGRIV
jgi:hypothetical protein